MSEQLSKEELVIATTLHHEHRSIVKSLFSTSKIPIKLFSNGTLYTERSDPLSHEATRQINIKGATVRYHFADEGQRFTYRVSTIISLVSSLLFFGLTMAWTDRILMGELGNGAEDLQEHFLYFWPILLWISIDFLRDRIGKQERLEITYEKGKTITLRGNLPFQGEHNFSAVMITIGIATSAIVLSPEDDLSILLFGILLWSALLYSSFTVLRWFLASQEGDKERNHQELIQFYFAIMNIKEGEIKKAFGDEEFRYYLIYILVATLAIAAALIGSGTGIGTSLRHSLFHVVSIGTSSGFVTTNYRDYSNGGDWPLVTHLIIFVLMIVGASAGSTAGGLKLLRVTLAFKVAMRELVKIAQPRKIDQIRMNGEVVERNQIGLIVGMLIVWVGLFGLSSIILAIFMPDNTFESVITVVASSLGNTGPALGEYGPHDTWASMNSGALIITSILMWFGRLELLTAVILIHPHTWRKEEKVQSDRSAIALYRRLMEDDDKD